MGREKLHLATLLIVAFCTRTTASKTSEVNAAVSTSFRDLSNMTNTGNDHVYDVPLNRGGQSRDARGLIPKIFAE